MRSELLQNLELGRADSAKPPCGMLSADGMGVKERQTQCLPYGWRPGRLGREGGNFSTWRCSPDPKKAERTHRRTEIVEQAILMG